MSVLSIICFIIFLASLFTLINKDTDAISPGKLTILVWSFVIGLTELKLSYYQAEWNLYSWIILLLSILSLCAGIFWVYVININKKIISLHYYRLVFNKTDINENILMLFTVILFFLYLISYYISYKVIGVIPLFTPRPDLVRTTWGIFGFGLFIQTSPVIIYFSLLIFYLSRKNLRFKIISALIFLITFVTYFFLLQRFNLLLGILLFGIFIYYSTDTFNFKKVILFALLIVGLLYGVSSIRTSKWAVNLLYYTSKMKFPVKYAIFTEPYMYIVMNLENFARGVEKLQHFTYGYFTFDFVMSLSGLKHMLQEYSNINIHPFLNSGYNTFTMFFYYYRDFGPLGAGVIPFAIGFAIAHAYYRMRNNFNINTISIYGMFVLVIIFSFFIPILSWLNFVFDFTIIYIVTRLINNNY